MIVCTATIVTDDSVRLHRRADRRLAGRRGGVHNRPVVQVRLRHRVRRRARLMHGRRRALRAGDRAEVGRHRRSRLSVGDGDGVHRRRGHVSRHPDGSSRRCCPTDETLGNELASLRQAQRRALQVVTTAPYPGDLVVEPLGAVPVASAVSPIEADVRVGLAHRVRRRAVLAARPRGRAGAAAGDRGRGSIATEGGDWVSAVPMLDSVTLPLLRHGGASGVRRSGRGDRRDAGALTTLSKGLWVIVTVTGLELAPTEQLGDLAGCRSQRSPRPCRRGWCLASIWAWVTFSVAVQV